MTQIIKRRGFMLVLSSPSGAGKTAIARRILETEANMSLSVSVTTRAPRPGEVNGKDYFFVDRPTFDGMVQRNEFLEHAEFCGNCYGAPTCAKSLIVWRRMSAPPANCLPNGARSVRSWIFCVRNLIAKPTRFVPNPRISN